MKKTPESQPAPEDNEVWQELIEDIAKIKKAPKATSLPKLKDIKIRPTLNVTPPSTQINSDLFDNTANIDGNSMRRFQKNDYPVEATLDLHGYTESRAYEAVHNFIQKSYQYGRRCVIIVTGKGYHASNDEDIFSNRAILKNAVPNWLNSEQLKPFILSFTHPKAELGGSGALYILLRKNKA